MGEVYTCGLILHNMSVVSNDGIEKTEVTYGTKSTTKVIYNFYQMQIKIWIFMQIKHGPLFRSELMYLSWQCKILGKEV